MATQMFEDGIWTWFNEPVAVYSSTYNATFLAWVDATGSVWAGKYNHVYKTVERYKLKASLDTDDHANPAVVVLSSGKIFVAYSQHNGDSYCRTSSSAGDIRAWGSEVTVSTGNTDAYAHCFQMGDTSETLYWFFRRGGSLPRPVYLRTSTDEGATWGSAVEVFSESSQRPYVRICQTSSTRLDFAVTTGQPSEATNSLYHFYMTVDSGGTRAYAVSDGTSLGADADLPFAVSTDFTQVYDGSTNECWVWDIRSDSDGLRIAFPVFTSSTVHEYHLARWSGSAWSTEKIADAGTTATEDYLYASEVNYSGGMSLVPNSGTVYLSREYGSGDFRVELWSKSGTWSKTSDISGNTGSVNARPVTTTDGVWYWSGTYTSYTSYATDIQYGSAVTLPTAKTASPAWQGSSYGPIGASAYFLLHEGTGTSTTEVVGSGTGTFVGSPAWGSGSVGPYISSLSTSNYITSDGFASAFGSAYPKWLAVLFSNTDSSTYGFAASFGNSADNDSIYGLVVNADGTTNQVRAFIRADNGSSGTSNATISEASDGGLHTMMIASTSASYHELVFDGTHRANGGAIGTITLDRFTIGCLRRAATGQGFPGKIYAVVFGTGSIPDYMSLHKDLVSGQFAGTFDAAASFQSAWARGSNIILGNVA